MAVSSLSSKAAADLDGIYEYAILHLGLEQARVYLLGLHERFQTTADLERFSSDRLMILNKLGSRVDVSVRARERKRETVHA